MIQSLLNGFVLGLIASPSCPSNTEEIRQGTRHGLVPALTVGSGAVIGDAVVLIVLLLGLAPLMERVQSLSTGLWIVGAAVMGYVAWGIFSEALEIDPEVAPDEPAHTVARVGPQVTAEGATGSAPGEAPRLAKAFWVGFAITTFNPFTLVWWLGLLGPVLAEGRGVPIGYPLAVLAGSMFWFASLAVLLHWGQRLLTPRVRRWILMLSGLVALGYALYFLAKAFSALV